MDDKNLHINPQLNGDYPQPDIPAEEAWSSMKEVLDAQMPVNADTNAGNTGTSKSRFWKLSSILLIIAITTFIVWRSNQPSQKDTQSKLEKLSEPKTENKRVANNFSNQNDPIIDTTSQKAAQNNSTSATSQQTLLETENHVNNFSGHPSGNNDSSLNNKNSVVNNNVITREKIHPIASKHLNMIGARNTSNNKVSNTTSVKNDGPLVSIHKSKPDQQSEITMTDEKLAEKRNEDSRLQVDSTRNILPEDRNREHHAIIINNMQALADSISYSDMVVSLKYLVNEKNNLSQYKISGKNKQRKSLLSDLDYGLQLNVNIPIQEDCQCNYFKDGKGKNAAWKLLIPGIWVGKTFAQKHYLQIQFSPYQQYSVGDKLIATDSFYMPPGLMDDTLLATRSTRIIKTTGLSAGIQYNYNLNHKWSVGVGADYYRQSRALFSEEVRRVYNNELMLYKVYGSKVSSDSIKRSAVIGSFNVMYNFKKIQLGARVMVPVTNFSTLREHSIYPVNGQLFIRWRWRKK